MLKHVVLFSRETQGVKFYFLRHSLKWPMTFKADKQCLSVSNSSFFKISICDEKRLKFYLLLIIQMYNMSSLQLIQLKMDN